MKFGFKTLIAGFAIGLVVAGGLLASGMFPLLGLVLGALVFKLATSAVFAWAGTSAGMLVVATMGALAGLATLAVLETFDRIFSFVGMLAHYAFAVPKAQSNSAPQTAAINGGSYQLIKNHGISIEPSPEVNSLKLKASNDSQVYNNKPLYPKSTAGGQQLLVEEEDSTEEFTL